MERTRSGTKQLNLEFIRQLFAKIQFDNGLASRLYPMENNKSIVVDPSAFKAYNDFDRVIDEYDVTKEDIEASLQFYEIVQN